MKYATQIFTLAALATKISASTFQEMISQAVNNIPEDFSEDLKNVSDENGQVRNAADASGHFRAITEASMAAIADYGCWCYFEEKHGAGKGKPVDAIDAMCHQLHQGYECVIMDNDDAGTPCVPWTEPFVAVAGFFLSENDVITQCDANNVPGTCAAQSCKVEGWFIQQFLTYSLQGNAVDSSRQHANGFNVKTECSISSGVKSDKACCGNFPNRFSYKDYGGNRACCDGATYNALMYTCCPDGSIKMAC